MKGALRASYQGAKFVPPWCSLGHLSLRSSRDTFYFCCYAIDIIYQPRSQAFSLPSWSIEGTGYEVRQTSKEQIYVGRSTSVHNLLICTHTLCMNHVTKMFLLVRSSVRTK